MTNAARYALLGAMILLVIAGFLFVRFTRYGLSAHDEPTKAEVVMAGALRRWASPADLRKSKNPLPASSEVLAEARSHFADHCAVCHGNDGKGQTTIGQKLFPRAPDMTLDATQSLSDGELFAVIENGIRLTGMPGWGDGTAASARGSWSLVHLVRNLSKLSEAELREMEKMNPMTMGQFEQMKEEEAFLEGEAGPSESKPPPARSSHGH
ncbi:MAG: c-type cytochrome [Acidobacteriota bacterium]|nr:c-type cytochrome [Acidobacteriota bacterium]MDQ5870687.1 c-type cytochrome [Acidobacteriota bacterium]